MGTNSNRRVLVGGVFDPLHAGHVAYLEHASRYGELVCALSDAPSKHPPLVPMGQRGQILRALGVRHVVEHDGTKIPELIDDLRPEVYVKGADWDGKLPQAERDACDRAGTRIVFTDTTQESSTRLLTEYERKRNAEKLADLEVFVRTQPAPEPWVPVTDYSREARRAIEAPHADILAEVFAGCSVLDYGCGFGYLVELLHERGMKVDGYDPHFKQNDTYLTDSRDVVICREVLEHVPMREWRYLIDSLVGLATRYVYLTTRFTAKPHLLDVDGSDDLDPTHISMANQDFLRALFVLHGCTRRADLEARLDHQRKGRVLVYEVASD